MARIQYKTSGQIRKMRLAGLVVARCLNRLSGMVRPGITPADIDLVARELLAAERASSNFLDYGCDWGSPYPAVSCISVNEAVVHAIPDRRQLEFGDIVSIDFGAIVDGWHGDAARTIPVGECNEAAKALIRTCQDAAWAGVAACWQGTRVKDISRAIENSIRDAGSFGIVRDFTGHGIGTEMHQEPSVPNLHGFGPSPKLRSGMVLAIEPMITLGSPKCVTLADEWTAVTADGSWAAHWENTVAITEQGLWVLTELDGGAENLKRIGIPFGPLEG